MGWPLVPAGLPGAADLNLDPEQLVVKANELDETIGWIFWLTETAIRFSTGFPPGIHRKFTPRHAAPSLLASWLPS
jgi:hypothetical protein